jgi:hypothetical protein
VSASAAQLDIGWNVQPRGESLDLRYARYLSKHPDILPALAWLARRKVAADKAKGLTPRVGAKALVERLRWGDLPADAPDYVLAAEACDNSFASRIARSLARSFVDLADVFVMKELDS